MGAKSLRMTVYQMAYLERVKPDHAAILKRSNREETNIKGLRNSSMKLKRSTGRVRWSFLLKDERERLSVEYSMPRWIVDLLFEQYGEEAREIFPSLNIAPHSKCAYSKSRDVG